MARDLTQTPVPNPNSADLEGTHVQHFVCKERHDEDRPIRCTECKVPVEEEGGGRC